MGQPESRYGRRGVRCRCSTKRTSFLLVCIKSCLLWRWCTSGSAGEAEAPSTAMRRFAVAASALLTVADLGSAVLVFAAVHGWQWHGLLRAWVRRKPIVSAKLVCSPPSAQAAELSNLDRRTGIADLCLLSLVRAVPNGATWLACGSGANLRR